jgi:hypothetical protein
VDEDPAGKIETEETLAKSVTGVKTMDTVPFVTVTGKVLVIALKFDPASTMIS